LRRQVARFAAAIKGGTLVDVGCGSRPYESLFDVDRYIGIDLIVSGRPFEWKKADIWFDGARLPFRSASVDHVLCTGAFEHTTDPYGYMGEIVRIMRPRGNLILSVPQSEPTFEVPYDRYRFTIHGLRDLCQAHGLTLAGAYPSVGYWQSLAYHLNTMVALSLLPRSKVLAMLLSAGTSVVTQSLAWVLDIFTKYDRDVNAWVIHAVKRER
jgi:SAM-dependent methyltransferase